MKATIVRTFDSSEGCSGDYSIDVVLPDGRSLNVANFLNWGDSNSDSERESEAMCLGWDLERRVKRSAWKSRETKNENESSEKAEIEVTDQEIAKIETLQKRLWQPCAS